MLAAVILITWPTTTALRLVVLLTGALVLLPWTVDRLVRAQRIWWWAWAPLVLGAALLIWSFISALGSGAPWALSLYGWYGRDNGILMLLGVFILLATGASLRKGEVRSALWWIVGAASVAALVSIAQALGVGLFTNPLAYEGANSLLGNPNFAAAFFAMTALISAGAALSSQSTRSRLAGSLAAASQVLAMLLATSQQGPFALAAGMAAGAVLLGLSSSHTLVKRLTATLAAGLVVASSALIAAGLAGAGPVAQLLRSDTLALRLEYWKASLATMLGVPVFGTGPDGLSRYIAEFRPESYVALLGPSTRVEAAHNIPLQFGATLGAVGLLLWIALALSVVALLAWSAWTWSSRSAPNLPWLLVTIGAAWTAYLAQAMVSIDMVVLMALGWTLAGLTVALSRSALPAASADQPIDKRPKSVPVVRKQSGALVGASAALGLLGVAITLPAYVAERTPAISTLEEAQQVLGGALTPCPTRLTVLNALSTQLDVTTYQELARTAVEIDPRCPPLSAIYADVALQGGDLAIANPQSLQAVELDPLDYQAWLLRSRVLSASGDGAGAQAAYEEAVRLAGLWPGSDQAYVEAIGAEIGLS